MNLNSFQSKLVTIAEGRANYRELFKEVFKILATELKSVREGWIEIKSEKAR